MYMEEELANDIVITCPHCQNPVLIEKLNCRIFRHGTLKTNGQQIEPHASKTLCDYYVAKDMIFGCGNPFRIVKNDDNDWTAIVCDYI